MDENFNNKQTKKMKKVSIFLFVIAILGVFIFIYFNFIKVDNKIMNNNITEKNDISSNWINNTNINSNTESNIYNESTTNSNNNILYDENGSFLMAIEDVFSITGRGVVATGKIERGTININDTVQIIGLKDETKTVVVTGIEMFRKTLDTAKAGDNVGLLLKNYEEGELERSDLERGQVLAKPNSIKNVSKFDAKVYVSIQNESKRKIQIFNGYKPNFYFRTTDITGTVKLLDGVQTVNPGDTVNINVELVSPVAIEEGTEFSIREGGRTLGKGTVTRIY